MNNRTGKVPPEPGPSNAGTEHIKKTCAPLTNMAKTTGLCAMPGAPDQSRPLRSVANPNHHHRPAHDRLDAPWVMRGPIKREVFNLHVETQPDPTLCKGDVVILENPAIHRSRDPERHRRVVPVPAAIFPGQQPLRHGITPGKGSRAGSRGPSFRSCQSRSGQFRRCGRRGCRRRVAGRSGRSGSGAPCPALGVVELTSS